ncbi:hypothetical protein ACH4C6_28590 [Streptomyces sp. NPDC017943]|uniref:hypothetical protein n=1 Tax=Streptomyces sp. NPDC017943 TaxID=3365019 RepID=UPI0037B883A9
MPLAIVLADTTEAKVDNTVAVLEETGRLYWAPRRYDSPYPKAVTARDYRQAVPVVVTTLEKLHEHGAGTAGGVATAGTDRGADADGMRSTTPTATQHYRALRAMSDGGGWAAHAEDRHPFGSGA